MNTFEDDNPKNIYVIRRKLTGYKKIIGNNSWELLIGNFSLRISLTTDEYWQFKDKIDDSIINHEKVNVDLYEDFSKSDSSLRRYVDLREDSRFKDCIPIQYNVIETSTGGRINLSDGREMPQLQLCELIRLLYRLSDLTAFM